jgi:hypothetical protein
MTCCCTESNLQVFRFAAGAAERPGPGSGLGLDYFRMADKPEVKTREAFLVADVGKTPPKPTSWASPSPRISKGVGCGARYPDSGPGGRRFKSSLPDQFFSTTCNRVKAEKCESLVLHQVLWISSFLLGVVRTRRAWNNATRYINDRTYDRSRLRLRSAEISCVAAIVVIQRQTKECV